MMETHTPTLEKYLSPLITPFDPVTIRRPLKVFSSSAGLKPGHPAVPHEDFLANLVAGRQSFLAVVRQAFGPDFRNFLNFSTRGAERTTPEVRARLLARMNGNEQTLKEAADAARQGVLAHKLAKIVQIGEGALFRFMDAAMSKKVYCPHCRKNVMAEPHAWWSAQKCDLGHAEYGFVDRILYDVLAATLLPLITSSRQEREVAASRLAALCADGNHVIGNWLELVCKEWHAENVTALPARARLQKVTVDSLYRYTRGEMITFEAVSELTDGRPKTSNLKRLGVAARALSFLADFIVAAHRDDEDLPHATAQQILRARLVRMKVDLRIAFLTPSPPVEHLRCP